MRNDDPRTGDASENEPALPANGVPELSPDPLVVASDAAELALANPVALIEGLRYLQQRIPGFTQLSAEEERSLIRVASLDPDFIEAGIRAGSAWSEIQGISAVPERSYATRRTRSATGTRWNSRSARS
jgi:hypothetical protein